MSGRWWLAGDAMFVALKLRGGLRPGDKVVVSERHLSQLSELVGRVCEVTAPTWFTPSHKGWGLIARETPKGRGIWVNENTIDAWQAGETEEND